MKKSMLSFSLCFCLLALALSACTQSNKNLKAEQDKIAPYIHVTRFEFGDKGNVEVSSTKNLKIDGRTMNYAELFAHVLREEMAKRDLVTSDLIPTRGGAYGSEELKGEKDFLVKVILTPKNISLLYAFLVEGKGFRGVEQFPPISAFAQQYTSDEEFYAGAKNELRPLANKMLDVIIVNAKSKNRNKF